MNFKQLVSKAALAAAVLAAPAFAQSWSSLVDTDTNRDFAGNNMVTNTYFGLTHKFVDGNTFTTEVLNDLVWRTNRVNDVKWKHGAVRFVYNINDLTTFGDHKFTLGFRYRAPTNTTEQLQGSFGQVLIRPTLKGKLGPVDYMLRDSFGPYLQRQRAQRNQKIGPTATASHNPLFVNITEIALGLPLGIEGLAFNTLWTNVNTKYGKANNVNGWWSGVFEQDYEIRYAAAALSGLEVAIAAVNGTTYQKTSAGGVPQSPSKNLTFSEESTYSLRITKGF